MSDTFDRERIETAILVLLSAREPGRTICPSDAARMLAPAAWRPLMQPVRETAFAMVDEGRLEVTQSGKVVDPRTARGAIRLRLPDAPPSTELAERTRGRGEEH